MKGLLEFDVIKSLPKHLRQFVVEQDYDSYTPIDHAVWRYVLQLNYKFLYETAHTSYVNGLKQTGIGLDRIPNIYEMNKVLSKIGWGAVCVDGFIPPSSFMEFQAYKVLVIAADIRHLEHIEYTPAPDIIHEAAGHAPIIADPEYADYLRFFGEIGSKAITHPLDYELYEAVRHLSIMKGDHSSSPKDINNATQKIEAVQERMDQPSEVARIRNLHWWTVEYGLIGSMEDPKIYGAGLLSSIGESLQCLGDGVKKIPYSIDAADFSFDITTMQPQLFVTPEFNYLTDVLNEFADDMALRKGGSKGLQKAIDSQATATGVLSSGLQISGTFTEMIKGQNGQPVFMRTTSPSSLCVDNKQLPGHGIKYHGDGYSTPIGKIKNMDKVIEDQTTSDLEEQDIIVGKETTLEFESGVKVHGVLKGTTQNNHGKTVLLTFDQCAVTYQGRTLFQPEWGPFDMGLGETVESVYAGPADFDAFGVEIALPSEKTHKAVFDENDLQLHSLYQRVSDIRNGRLHLDELQEIFETITINYPDDILLMIEIYELLNDSSDFKELKAQVFNYLDVKKNKSDDKHQFFFNNL